MAGKVYMIDKLRVVLPGVMMIFEKSPLSSLKRKCLILHLATIGEHGSGRVRRPRGVNRPGVNLTVRRELIDLNDPLLHRPESVWSSG
jgi:hypothetical protein